MKSSGTDMIVRDLGTLFSLGAIGGLSDGQLLGRFVERREAAAFEVIVHRHGPMVWGVSRRVLRDRHDAEDAFQATFLVLARKAASVLPREKLGNWLYGVAYQTARKARAMRTRRRVREGQVSDMPEPMAMPDRVWDALTESLDRELNRMPQKYRIPIILCDLEGKTHKEAARQLGWPIGTVSSRLSRARTMLAIRLSRPDMMLTVGSLASLLARDAESASVSTKLVGVSAQTASLIAEGRAATAGLVSAKVAALTGEMLKVLLLGKLKVATIVLLFGMITVGVAVGGQLASKRAADSDGKSSGQGVEQSSKLPSNQVETRLLDPKRESPADDPRAPENYAGVKTLAEAILVARRPLAGDRLMHPYDGLLVLLTEQQVKKTIPVAIKRYESLVKQNPEKFAESQDYFRSSIKPRLMKIVELGDWPEGSTFDYGPSKQQRNGIIYD